MRTRLAVCNILFQSFQIKTTDKKWRTLCLVVLPLTGSLESGCTSEELVAELSLAYSNRQRPCSADYSDIKNLVRSVDDLLVGDL